MNHKQSMKKAVRFCLVLLALVSGTTAFAQNITIKGKVLDQNQEPLWGAAVMVKDTNIGDVTNEKGEYTLQVPKGANLFVSMMGYVSQTVAIGERTQIDFVLLEDNEYLDDVVVIAYGAVSRKNYTGSVSSVNLKDSPLGNLPVTSPFALLQGTTTGINFTQSGEAGKPLSMQVRGQKSISGGSDPLIVVDGVIFTGSLNDINPDAVESMNILKDATSLAAYGSQAANGVIMVTTKKGQQGKTMVNFNASTTISTPDYRPNLRTGKDYVELMNARFRTDDPKNWLPTLTVKNYESGNETDWYDLITRTGVQQNYSVSVSGANEKTDYFVSGSYLDNKNFIVGDEFNRTTFSARLNTKINNYMTFGINTNQSFNKNDNARPDYNAAVTLSPYTVPYLEDGRLRKYVDGKEESTKNPLWNTLSGSYDYMNRRKSSVIGASFEVKFPWVEGLSYKITGSYTTNDTNIKAFTHESNFVNISLGEAGYTTSEQDKYLNQANGSITYSSSKNWVLDNILTYTREIGKHYINATAVYTRDSQNVEGTVHTGSDFSEVGNTTLGVYGLNNAKNQKTTSITYTLHNNVGYLGRVNYSYRNTYHLNASIRRDGSSVFGPNKKWGIFPAVGGAWTISDEPFMKSLRSLDNLKLKLSWGKNGNQSLRPYGTLSILNVGMAGGLAYYLDDNKPTWGQSVSTLGNHDLGWESTESLNGGFELDMFDRRIHLEVDGYKSKTTDQIFNRTIPVMGAGITTQSATMGRVDNWGVEAVLNTTNVRTNDFTWTTGINFTINRNKLVDLGYTDEDDIANNRFLGESLGAIYGYSWIGVVQESDTDYMNANGAKPGDAMFANLDGSEDGRITASDREILGFSKDAFRMGIQNTFRYKNLQLFVLFNGTFSGGRYGLAANNMRYLSYEGYGYRSSLNHPFWTESNPSDIYPSVHYSDTRFTALDKYGFLRLQDVNLSYTLGKKVTNVLNVSTARVSISGKNLFFIAPGWDGSDPEVRSYDSAQLPRSISLGINVSF